MSLIRFDEQLEPATPPVGKVSLYVDSVDSEVAIKKDDGSVQKFLNTVISVNGLVGTVVLTTTEVAEGINLYYTQTRFDNAFSLKDTDNLIEGISNLYYTQTRFDNAFTAKNTDALTEGSANLYYTDVRADARITLQKGAANGIATLGGDSKIPSSQLPALAITSTVVISSEVAQLALSAQEGDVAIRTDLNESFIHNGGTSGTIADWAMLLTPTDTVLSVNGFTGAVVLTTSDISEGTNLYYTQTRFDTAFGGKTTDDLPEGVTNLYANALTVTVVTTQTYTLLTTDDILNISATTTGSVIITLPTAQMVSGRLIEIKDSGFNADTNNISILTEGAELIENDTDVLITKSGTALTIYTDGLAWFIY